MTGSVNPNLPTIGDPNSTEDADVRNSFITLRDALNAVLTPANALDGATLGAATVSDAKLASPMGAVWATIAQDRGMARGVIPNVAGTYALTGNSISAFATSDNSFATPFGLDAANLTVAGKTTQLRVHTIFAVNNTAPGINFTAGLYPIGSAQGASGQLFLNNGTVVTGSTVAVSLPGANGIYNLSSSDFAVPTAGAFALGVVLSGTIAAASYVMISCRLIVHWT